MWDYDKLFAEYNIVGVKYFNYISNHVVQQKKCWGFNFVDDWGTFCNDELKAGLATIEYIIRLDGHGNVIEKLFDREKDMPKPMPKLKTGMFIRVIDNQSMGKTTLGYVDTINNNIVYQDGTYNEINYLRKLKGIVDIVEIYSEKSLCFDLCDKNNIIWRAPEYQKYLDSQTK